MAAPTKKNASSACVIPGGFTVLSLKFRSNSTAQHQLCVKEHRVRAQTSKHRPPDRTLFVLNVPPYCSQEAELQKKEAEEQQEDEEGWVKVTKGGKGIKSRPHSEAANQRALQKEHNKKKRKELLNFYTWQHRNSKREHIAELRRKFEEDKQRIALLRAQRKFRPY
ncbi:hypothetical protein PGIGA_G00177410 [Pangasianodon gigas]|uniref:Uncharacterized protein n=1 Tax=Pangasianodon gigas TaxID=30993 RepID=A0ACC5XVC8_PANGG|nr:hypothetical protein [Pangasianodon gigas]